MNDWFFELICWFFLIFFFEYWRRLCCEWLLWDSWMIDLSWRLDELLIETDLIMIFIFGFSFECCYGDIEFDIWEMIWWERDVYFLMKCRWNTWYCDWWLMRIWIWWSIVDGLIEDDDWWIYWCWLIFDGDLKIAWPDVIFIFDDVILLFEWASDAAWLIWILFGFYTAIFDLYMMRDCGLLDFSGLKYWMLKFLKMWLDLILLVIWLMLMGWRHWRSSVAAWFCMTERIWYLIALIWMMDRW